MYRQRKIPFRRRAQLLSARQFSKNPHLSVEQLIRLLTRHPREALQSPLLSLLLLENPQQVVGILESFSDTTLAQILEHWHIFSNNGNDALLQRWAKHESRIVRRAVALQKNTGAAVLQILADDLDSEIRYLASIHENMPAHVLEKYMAYGSQKNLRNIDADFDFQNAPMPAVFMQDDTYRDLLPTLGYWQIYLLSRHQNIPADALIWFATYPMRAIRLHVAANPHTPAQVLQRFLRDASLWRALYHNPAISEDEKRHMASYSIELGYGSRRDTPF